MNGPRTMKPSTHWKSKTIWNYDTIDDTQVYEETIATAVAVVVVVAISITLNERENLKLAIYVNRKANRMLMMKETNKKKHHQRLDGIDKRDWWSFEIDLIKSNIILLFADPFASHRSISRAIVCQQPQKITFLSCSLAHSLCRSYFYLFIIKDRRRQFNFHIRDLWLWNSFVMCLALPCLGLAYVWVLPISLPVCVARTIHVIAVRFQLINDHLFNTNAWVYFCGLLWSSHLHTRFNCWLLRKPNE